MDKRNYDGQLRRQCMSLTALCEEQIAGLRKGLADTIPAERLKKIRRVIITGCGDSYFAANVCIPAFKHYAGSFGNGFVAVRNIDAARKTDFNDQPDATMLIAVSASGGPARVQEALRRARGCGCATLLVTNNPQSKSAKEAEYLMNVNTPVFPEMGPGLRNYYASISGLLTLAAYMGEVKGLCAEGAAEELFDAVRTYTAGFGKELERMDEQMFAVARAWEDIVAVEAVGDHTDRSSAAFIAAKFVEVDGMMTAVADSENWCHVNYFAHTPEKLGTIVLSTRRFPNFSRVKETLVSAGGIGRKVLLITTGSREEYEVKENVTVCTIPEAPEGYGFIEPLLNYVPGAILASYISALHEEPYFRGKDSVHSTSAVGNTIGTSEITIL